MFLKLHRIYQVPPDLLAADMIMTFFAQANFFTYTGTTVPKCSLIDF